MAVIAKWDDTLRKLGKRVKTIAPEAITVELRAVGAQTIDKARGKWPVDTGVSRAALSMSAGQATTTGVVLRNVATYALQVRTPKSASGRSTTRWAQLVVGPARRSLRKIAKAVLQRIKDGIAKGA